MLKRDYSYRVTLKNDPQISQHIHRRCFIYSVVVLLGQRPLEMNMIRKMDKFIGILPNGIPTMI